MYITNNPKVAVIAENAGVDWIFLDLEVIGKAQRQAHLDTVISNHKVDDIPIIKKCLSKARLLVRVNPIYYGSETEINNVVDAGADIVMLPYFKTAAEVSSFLAMVKKRTKVCLLLETPEAVECVDNILDLPGINYIHIGLNDLHLGYNMKFMFELLADGTVEYLCGKFAAKGLNYGFGGVAKFGSGLLSAKTIIGEHIRLGSTQAILSRSFCNFKRVNDLREVDKVFKEGVKEIRQYEAKLREEDSDFFENNRLKLVKMVNKIIL